MLNLRSAGLSYEELYGAAYALVLRKRGDVLYDAICDTVTDHLCLHITCKIADVAGDEEFLRDLQERFVSHRRSARMLADVFIYLDRVHLQRSATKNLEPVEKLCMTLWCECVVNNPRIRRRMRSCMLDMIRRERDGETVSGDALREVTSMLMTLGESVYVDEFETNMLDETTSYYRALAQKRIDMDDCPTYLKMAETRLEGERRRAEPRKLRGGLRTSRWSARTLLVPRAANKCPKSRFYEVASAAAQGPAKGFATRAKQGCHHSHCSSRKSTRSIRPGAASGL